TPSWNGRANVSTTYAGDDLTSTQLTTLRNAVAAGKNVVADTRDTATQLSTDVLVPWHDYTVIRVDYVQQNDGSWAYFVVMRNPWGYDNKPGHATYGDANDGIVSVSWTDFSKSMDGFYVA